MKTALSIIFLIVISFYLLLLFSDNRILLSETRVKDGQSYFVEGYGDIGKNAKQDSLACLYFNGRKLFTKVYWYSSNNMFGRDSCKFYISKDDEK